MKTHKEIYDLKRANFKKESLLHFQFLTEELGYNEPNITEYEQSNGTVISDKIEYQNIELKKTICIENNYHPVDYGFEFNLWNSLTDINHSDGEILELYLKEKQDIEQSYIQKIAEIVKEKHITKLT